MAPISSFSITVGNPEEEDEEAEGWLLPLLLVFVELDAVLRLVLILELVLELKILTLILLFWIVLEVEGVVLGFISLFSFNIRWASNAIHIYILDI